MKIKKVDDKPMVIHTKKKAKLHTHEPKKASIKAANIYTYDERKRQSRWFPAIICQEMYEGSRCTEE